MIHTALLTDVANDVYLPSYEYRKELKTPQGVFNVAVYKRRLQGGLRDGVDVVEIESGRFSFTVALTRGMNVLKAKCDDLELKWDSPVPGPVHPKFVPLFAPNGCGWLEGFCEWIARCGLESNGAPEFDANGVLKYPLHGRLANLPAQRAEATVDEESGEVSLTGETLETSVFGRRFLMTTKYSIKAGSTKLLVEDTVENLASVDDEFELLYHINTGYPLVSPGAQFFAAFDFMCPRDANAVADLPQWNRFVEPIPGRPETCNFFDLATDSVGNATVALVGAEKNKGLALSFNKRDFPYFILWKTQRPNGDIYVSGMEPAINFPNTRSFEKKMGRVMSICAKEKKTFRFELEALTDSETVDARIEAIAQQQKNAKGEIARAPIPQWCE